MLLNMFFTNIYAMESNADQLQQSEVLSHSQRRSREERILSSIIKNYNGTLNDIDDKLYKDSLVRDFTCIKELRYMDYNFGKTGLITFHQIMSDVIEHILKPLAEDMKENKPLRKINHHNEFKNILQYTNPYHNHNPDYQPYYNIQLSGDYYAVSANILSAVLDPIKYFDSDIIHKYDMRLSFCTFRLEKHIMYLMKEYMETQYKFSEDKCYEILSAILKNNYLHYIGLGDGTKILRTDKLKEFSQKTEDEIREYIDTTYIQSAKDSMISEK